MGLQGRVLNITQIYHPNNIFQNVSQNSDLLGKYLIIKEFNYSLTDTAIVTGASSGMGYEIAKSLALKGYNVVMGCRDTAKGEYYKELLIKETNHSSIEVIHLDLSSFHSVYNFTEKLRQSKRKITRLMNNAGVFCPSHLLTDDGYEMTISTNYLGHVLLTLRLLPLMPQHSRIVNMLSLSYVFGLIESDIFIKKPQNLLQRIASYANSKLALYLFTSKLSKVLIYQNIYVSGADPGIVSTGMTHLGHWIDAFADIFVRPILRTPIVGATPAINLLLNEYPMNNIIMALSGIQSIKDLFINHPNEELLWNCTTRVISPYLGI